jgi:hypothetical protein
MKKRKVARRRDTDPLAQAESLLSEARRHTDKAKDSPSKEALQELMRSSDCQIMACNNLVVAIRELLKDTSPG